jgi:hypothetical protein
VDWLPFFAQNIASLFALLLPCFCLAFALLLPCFCLAFALLLLLLCFALHV